jgi:hypothetical protein
MASVKILSVNCQGLGNIVKRTDVFNYLKKKNKNNDCNQTWLQKAKQHNILQFLQL